MFAFGCFCLSGELLGVVLSADCICALTCVVGANAHVCAWFLACFGIRICMCCFEF